MNVGNFSLLCEIKIYFLLSAFFLRIQVFGCFTEKPYYASAIAAYRCEKNGSTHRAVVNAYAADHTGYIAFLQFFSAAVRTFFNFYFFHKFILQMTVYRTIIIP